MAFTKNGEVKVFKRGNKVGPKLASKDETNRFTIDDLIKESDKSDLTLDPKMVIPKEEKETEDVSS